MAVYKLFPIQDATVYSGYPSMNSGLDSLLEVTSEFPQTLTPSPRVARSLLKFDQNEIDSFGKAVFNIPYHKSIWENHR